MADEPAVRLETPERPYGKHRVNWEEEGMDLEVDNKVHTIRGPEKCIIVGAYIARLGIANMH